MDYMNPSTISKNDITNTGVIDTLETAFENSRELVRTSSSLQFVVVGRDIAPKQCFKQVQISVALTGSTERFSGS